MPNRAFLFDPGNNKEPLEFTERGKGVSDMDRPVL